MWRFEQERKMIWMLILGRLLLATILLSFGNILFGDEGINYYFLIAAVYLLSVIYLGFLRFNKGLKFLVFFQIAADLILATFLIYGTGGGESALTILYVFTILSASLVLSASAGIVVASMASVLYTALSWQQVFPNGLAGIMREDFLLAQINTALLYRVYVHAVTFSLLGILFYWLMRRLTHLEEKTQMQAHLALIGEISSQIAHEIRNPLTTVSGAAELLKEKLGARLDAPDVALMDAMVKESLRAGNILQNFLDYAKWQSVRLEKVLLTQLLDEVLTLFEFNQRRGKHVSITRQYADRLWVQGDSDKLKQVFVNIVKNAMEAMPGTGVLAVTAKREGEEIVICFQDTGTGIPKAQLRKLFKPFQSGSKDGTGLGLVIADKIIRLHAGYIEIKSKINQGTRVNIILPGG